MKKLTSIELALLKAIGQRGSIVPGADRDDEHQALRSLVKAKYLVATPTDDGPVYSLSAIGMREIAP